MMDDDQMESQHFHSGMGSPPFGISHVSTHIANLIWMTRHFSQDQLQHLLKLPNVWNMLIYQLSIFSNQLQLRQHVSMDAHQGLLSVSLAVAWQKPSMTGVSTLGSDRGLELRSSFKHFLDDFNEMFLANFLYNKVAKMIIGTKIEIEIEE